MPCDTITRVKLELKNADFTLLKKALKSALQVDAEIRGQTNLYWYGGQYDKQTGQLTVRSEQEGKVIRQAYSAEVLKAQASRFGWQVKQTSANKFQIIKR